MSPFDCTTALLSHLGDSFSDAIAYAHVTQQEALDVIAFILSCHPPDVHRQLLNTFLREGLVELVPNTDYYRITTWPHVNGVFTPVAACYSSTCTRHAPSCYSPICPNRQKLPSTAQPTHLWLQRMPRHILQKTHRHELMRQAAISDLVSMEERYVSDLKVLESVYEQALVNAPIVSPSYRDQFFQLLFGNYGEIAALHRQFAAELQHQRRDHNQLLYEHVGEAIHQHIVRVFDAYVAYTANHIKSSYALRMERARNVAFANVLDTLDGSLSARRLDLSHFLTAPTLWIGKFRMLVDAIVKRTPTKSLDHAALVDCLGLLHELLTCMNDAATQATVATRRAHVIATLSTALAQSPWSVSSDAQESVFPRNASLVHEGQAKFLRHAGAGAGIMPASVAMHGATPTSTLSPGSACHVFLFDHMVFIAQPKTTSAITGASSASSSRSPSATLVMGPQTSSAHAKRASSFISPSSSPLLSATLPQNTQNTQNTSSPFAQPSAMDPGDTTTTTTTLSGHVTPKTGMNPLPPVALEKANSALSFSSPPPPPPPVHSAKSRIATLNDDYVLVTKPIPLAAFLFLDDLAPNCSPLFPRAHHPPSAALSTHNTADTRLNRLSKHVSTRLSSSKLWSSLRKQPSFGTGGGGPMPVASTSTPIFRSSTMTTTSQKRPSVLFNPKTKQYLGDTLESAGSSDQQKTKMMTSSTAATPTMHHSSLPPLVLESTASTPLGSQKKTKPLRLHKRLRASMRWSSAHVYAQPPLTSSVFLESLNATPAPRRRQSVPELSKYATAPTSANGSTASDSASDASNKNQEAHDDTEMKTSPMQQPLQRQPSQNHGLRHPMGKMRPVSAFLSPSMALHEDDDDDADADDDHTPSSRTPTPPPSRRRPTSGGNRISFASSSCSTPGSVSASVSRASSTFDLPRDTTATLRAAADHLSVHSSRELAFCHAAWTDTTRQHDRCALQCPSFQAQCQTRKAIYPDPLCSSL
ncbi:hypothetical protein BC940DRAFT_157706 [Gongronella butleri]|nr:hypothetical protein BC940DRAFT_157706 [Gongronella butleri]